MSCSKPLVSSERDLDSKMMKLHRSRTFGTRIDCSALINLRPSEAEDASRYFARDLGVKRFDVECLD